MGGGGGYTLALDIWLDRLGIADPLEREALEHLLEAMESEENAFHRRKLRRGKKSPSDEPEDHASEISHIRSVTRKFRRRHGLDRDTDHPP